MQIGSDLEVKTQINADEDPESFTCKISRMNFELIHYQSDLGQRNDENFNEFNKRLQLFQLVLQESLNILCLFSPCRRERIENDIMGLASACYLVIKNTDNPFYKKLQNWKENEQQI